LLAAAIAPLAGVLAASTDNLNVNIGIVIILVSGAIFLAEYVPTTQSGLSYLTNEEGACRLYLCDECYSYLKAVDLRKKEVEVSMPWERIQTLVMDRQAQQEGYQALAGVSDSVKGTHLQSYVMGENPPTGARRPVRWREIQRPEGMGAQSEPERTDPQGVFH